MALLCNDTNNLIFIVMCQHVNVRVRPRDKVGISVMWWCERDSEEHNWEVGGGKGSGGTPPDWEGLCD